MADSNSVSGRIIKQTGGFYYLDCAGLTVETRARGKFRKDGLSPVVGDMATAELSHEGTGYLVSVAPRKNSLVRPLVANVDLVLMIVSAKDPDPNFAVIDKLLAVCQYKDIDAAVIVTKADLDPEGAAAVVKNYQQAGYFSQAADFRTGGADFLRPLVAGKLCVLSGNTGAGKSTLLNMLRPQLGLQTGETSKKLGRGRHTTRTTELFPVFEGFVADTPGFSSLETVMLERIKKESLEHCFREFAPFLGQCRFTGCAHIKEKGCAVLQAVTEGEISAVRHKSYCDMYDEAKLLKDWED